MSAHQSNLPHGRHLSTFGLTLISISAIIGLRNLPTFAINGLTSTFFLFMVATLFFIPVALVCAELASGWPKKGGIYAWVHEAFGEKGAALVVWLEWVSNVVCLPLSLTFVGATFAYVIDPELAHNRVFLLSIMLIALWGGTFLNFLELTASEWVSSFGMVVGSLVPGLAIIGLGLGWMITGNPIQIEFNMASILPEFKLDTLVYFTGIMLSFVGIEIAGFYIQDTKNPQRTFPKATFISAFTIIIIYTLGALAIAIVVPKEEITLHAGLMQAVTLFFEAFHIPWATPIFAGFAVIGALALLNTWLIGPCKGLLASAHNHDLPSFTKRTNKVGSPVVILCLQALIGTALACMLLFMPSISAIYFLLTVLATQLVLLMYLMIFVSAIRLRYTQPDTHRLYKIPGGKVGIWLVSGFGTLSCTTAFCLGFVPPVDFDFGETTAYASILMTGLFLFCIPPFIFQYHKHQKSKRLSA